jgi:hypothetical protein
MTDVEPSVVPLLSNFMPPLVSREKFSELVGLPIGVIVGFINKGYLPTVTIGVASRVIIYPSVAGHYSKPAS